MLFVAVILMAFHLRGPYIIASFIGQSGSAKSTLLTVLRWFVDPSMVERSSLSKDGEALMVAILNRWLLTFDNLAELSQEQQDDFCRTATGGASTRRTKFSDSEESVFSGKNPVALTSIKDVLTNTDALERAIRFVLPRITARKSETAFYTAWRLPRRRSWDVFSTVWRALYAISRQSF